MHGIARLTVEWPEPRLDATAPIPQFLLRLETVCAATQNSPAMIYANVRRGTFPPPVKLGSASAWINHEVLAWQVLERQRRATPVPREGLAPASRWRLLRVDDVVALTGIGEHGLLTLIDNGKFPRPVHLAQRARTWVNREVMEALDKLAAARGRDVSAWQLPPEWQPADAILPRQLNIQEASEMLRVGITLIGELIQNGRFPVPLLLGTRVRAWESVTLEQLIIDRMQERDGGGHD